MRRVYLALVLLAFVTDAFGQVSGTTTLGAFKTKFYDLEEISSATAFVQRTDYVRVFAKPDGKMYRRYHIGAGYVEDEIVSPATSTTAGTVSATTQDFGGLKTLKAGVIAELPATSGTTNDMVLARNTAATASLAVGYDFTNARGYIGTRTNHPLSIMVNAGTGILLDTSQNISLPGSAYAGRGIVHTDSVGTLSKTNVWVSGAYRHTSSTCSTSGANGCTFTQTYGGGITATYTQNSAGDYTVHFTSSFWSTPPVCTVTPVGGSMFATYDTGVVPTTSQIRFYIRADNGVMGQADFHITCIGPRA